MIYLLNYWYLRSPSWFYASFLNAIGNLEGTFAIRATAKNIRKPLFQDYTREGRIIGFMLRCARILAGLLIYLVVALLFIAAFSLWIAFPIFCLVASVGGIFGSTGGEV